MARRRQEIALQTEVESQEEWNETVNKEGLTVIDVYQTYGGPCKALEAKFRAIKNTLGDPLLYFVVAKADTIDSLEKYRGRCEPCFLFYASGTLVDVVIGANAPELQRKIISNLEQEKRILKEGGERIEYRFERSGSIDEDGDGTGAGRHRSPSIVNAIGSQQYTLAVIRPNAHAEAKTVDISDKIIQNGFKILLQQEHTLNDHDARQFHRHKMNDEGYEDHIALITSGPSVVLLLQKTDAKDSSVDDFREFVNSDELLKETVDCTQSADNVQSDLMLLLPNIARKDSPEEKPIERTVVLIRPSALKLFKDAIIQRIQDSGFDVTRTNEIQLTQDQAEQFYAEKKDKPYYNDIIHEMTSGPVLALYLTKRDAVKGFRTLLGPAEKEKIKESSGTFRHDFDIADVKVNSLHAAGTRNEVTRNLQFFFPEEHIFVILKPNLTAQQRSEIVDIFKKAGFFILARKVEQLTTEQVAQLQHAHHGKDYYEELENYLTSGPSEILALAKENASNSWQDIVGAEEPAKASESAPTSIRALYGQDLVHNAVDVSSDAQQVQNDIQLVFGNLNREEHVYLKSKSFNRSLSTTPDMTDEFEQDE